MDTRLSEALERHLALMACPRCGSVLTLEPAGLRCGACRQAFGVSGNIPQLFWPNEWDEARPDVTSTVQSFYEDTPFPNYEDLDDVGSLIEKARRGVFAQLLDHQVPPGTRILECGCGTGQMSNFLGVANRTVFGTDLSLPSLALGQQFKERHDLRTVHFLQMNLFRPCFKPGSFDLVVCNGVLHHTSNPLLGFQTLARLVRPKGYVLIGLYHRYGRLVTNVRRRIFALTGTRFAFLDPNLRKRDGAASRQRAWFMDQYNHPHESRHTISEVIEWVARTGLTFVKSIPKVNGRPFREDERLFDPETPGHPLQRWLGELAMVFGGSREGGFFIVIAQAR